MVVAGTTYRAVRKSIIIYISETHEEHMWVEGTEGTESRSLVKVALKICFKETPCASYMVWNCLQKLGLNIHVHEIFQHLRPKNHVSAKYSAHFLLNYNIALFESFLFADIEIS